MTIRPPHATARFYGAFCGRTVSGQARSAWRIEAKRLGDESHSRGMIRGPIRKAPSCTAFAG